MFKCRNCKLLFEEIKTRPYRDPDTNFEGLEHLCPYCGSDEFKEIDEEEEE